MQMFEVRFARLLCFASLWRQPMSVFFFWQTYFGPMSVFADGSLKDVELSHLLLQLCAACCFGTRNYPLQLPGSLACQQLLDVSVFSFFALLVVVHMQARYRSSST